MPRTIIFDFDGTIANTLEATVEIYNELAPRFHSKPINSDDLGRLKNGRPRELMTEFGVSAWKLPFIVFAIRNGLRDREVLPQDGIIDVLRELKNQGVVLIILTSNSKENVERFLEKYDLQNSFAFTNSYHRVFGKHKALQKIVTSQKLNASEVAYIGDEVRDIEAAKKAGIKSVGVTWGFQTKAAIKSAQPDVIANTPKDLLKLSMEFKQSTIEEIIESEHGMLQKAPERFGEYFTHAMEGTALLNSFLVSVDIEGHIFTAFLAQIRKHVLLAIFSSVRLHQVQAMMDMRQALEAGSCAAFAIKNPDVSGFADIDESGMIDATQELTKKRYKWLEENFPAGSEAIKNMKKVINSSTAHSNLIYAMQSFALDASNNQFTTPFFDVEDDHHVKTNLWMIGNVTYGLMYLFFGINQGNKGMLKFQPDFVDRLKSFHAKNDELKSEMMSSSRYLAATQSRPSRPQQP